MLEKNRLQDVYDVQSNVIFFWLYMAFLVFETDAFAQARRKELQ